MYGCLVLCFNKDITFKSVMSRLNKVTEFFKWFGFGNGVVSGMLQLF